jgi:hypothetical protein
MKRLMLTLLLSAAFAAVANATPAKNKPAVTAVKPVLIAPAIKIRATLCKPVKLKNIMPVQQKDLAVVTDGKKTITYTPLFENKSIKVKSAHNSAEAVTD